MARLVESEEYLVVLTAYRPADYGCGRLSEAKLIGESDVVEHGPFSREEAHRLARVVRASDDRFEGETEELPPYDSSDFGCIGEREEVLIEVLSVSEVTAREKRASSIVQEARGKETFELRMEQLMTARLVQSAGRCHYSKPPRPYDISADVDARLGQGTSGAPSEKDRLSPQPTPMNIPPDHVRHMPQWHTPDVA